MSDILKRLLSATITAGLSDRETFVKHVSGLIEKYQEDPEKAEQWGKALVDYFENMRDFMNTKMAITGAIDNSSLPQKEQIEELTKAIKKLTEEMQNQRAK